MKHSLFLGLILIWNLVLSYQLLIRKDFKVRILEAQRVNIVEKDGTKKMGLFSSGQYQYGLSERQGQGTISGMLFFNEEGYETGGLVFDGKKIKGGHQGGIGLMFDGYRQDQTIKIEHDEYKDEQERYYEDGILIMARPDRADVKEEYDFYALKYPNQFGDEDTPRLSKEVLDSMEWVLSEQNKVATRRIYLGSRRGLTNGEWYDNTGLLIRNKHGRKAINIFVGKDNRPRFEVYDSLGKEIVYQLIPEVEGER